MDCRIVTETEMPQVMALWDYCFEKKDDPFFQWYFQEYCLQHNLVLGGFSEDDGHLQNMLHLNPYSILLRGQEERVPYIVGVATDPADRGRHLTEELLQSAFRLLRRKGCAFALLMPVNAGIYRNYDFAFCYRKHVYEMPLDKLIVPVPSGNLWMKHYSSYDSALFEDLYAALAEGYNGLPIRTDFQWQKLLAVHQLEQVQAAVVYHGNEPRGYMFYQIENKTFFIQELVALTPDAKWALLRYAGEHQSSADKLYWEAMEDDLTWLDFPEADRAGRVKPFMMARCFDAVQALQRYEVPDNCPDGQVTLLLQDDLLEENNCLVTLTVDTGSLYLEKAAGDADAVIPMGAFTQLYFGAFTFTQLVEAGKIRMHSYRPELPAFLDALFPRCV
ncbi:MAG: GNAT family N-acetyltransferase, partial [Acidaminococcaceae bacterium]|nr:GNAT family N-acetyltransferase [Acidaminococcaceae bacterium]